MSTGVQASLNRFTPAVAGGASGARWQVPLERFTRAAGGEMGVRVQVPLERFTRRRPVGR
jgi:hypothetical protein